MSSSLGHFVCIGLLTWPCSLALGDSTARQDYLVHVPPRVSITAPESGPHAVLDPEEPHIAFETQTWEVSSNRHAGATVQFSTEHCFRNIDDESIQRDAQLEISLLQPSSPGAWSVTQPTGATSYRDGQEHAVVQVRSLRPGRARIGLTVKFLQDDALSTPGGDYVTTVIGTITAD